MRKIIMFNLMTLDGYFAGLNGEIDWHNAGDEEFNQFAIEQIDENYTDTIIFGRKTYELMSSYWPTEEAKKDDPIIAEYMNKKKKLVFSRTLDQVNWNNTRLIKDDAVSELKRIKNEKGKNMIIFGSANLCSSLIEAGLIDEFNIMINPLILGNGKPLFQLTKKQIGLKFLSSRNFKNGNVLVCYKKGDL